MTNTTNPLDQMAGAELCRELDRCWGLMRALVPMLVEVGADAERALAAFHESTAGHDLDGERYLQMLDESVAGGLEQVLDFIILYAAKVRGDIDGMPASDRYDDLYRDVVLTFTI